MGRGPRQNNMDKRSKSWGHSAFVTERVHVRETAWDESGEMGRRGS